MAAGNCPESNVNVAGAGMRPHFACPSFSVCILLSDRTPAPMLRRLLLTGLFLALPLARAQSVFVVVDGAAPKMVKEIRSGRPLIEKDGKPAVASTDRYAFSPAPLYRPGLVTLSNFRVSVSHVETMNGDQFNYDLHIHGRATSDTAFKKVFMVLEMTAWKVHGIAFTEVPDLPPGETVDLNLTFHLADKIEEGSYRLHLFSDGIELLHTRLPAGYVAKQKEKTQALLSGRTQDWPPIVAHKVNPTYPEALKKSQTAGAVRVRLHVTRNGDVDSPEIVQASDPRLGEAALAAVAKWKFDPALKGRKFVDANIEVPINFAPPK